MHGKGVEDMKLVAQANIALIEIIIVLVGVCLLYLQQNSNADFFYEAHMHDSALFKFNPFFQLFATAFEITKNII